MQAVTGEFRCTSRYSRLGGRRRMGGPSRLFREDSAARNDGLLWGTVWVRGYRWELGVLECGGNRRATPLCIDPVTGGGGKRSATPLFPKA